MKKTQKLVTLAAAMFAFAALMTPLSVMALTTPCTEITNQANLAYKVGNVAQPAVLSDKDTDDTLIEATKFNVGVKILVTVTSQDAGNVGVVPSTTDKVVLTFKVRSQGNAVHDFALSRIPATNGIASHTATNDTWDLLVAPEDGNTTSAVKFWLESGLNAASGLDSDDIDITATMKIDNLDPATTYNLNSTPTPEGTAGTRTIYVEYLPAELVALKDTVTVNYLKAVTQWKDGSALPVLTGGNGTHTPTAAEAGGACDGTITVDVVAGDDDGDGGGGANDADRNAADLDWGAFVVSNAVIDHTKTFWISSDGVNAGCAAPQATNPCKPIPGAVARYTLEIKNTGNAPAILGTITDAIDNNFKIVSAASWAVTGSTRSPASGVLTAGLPGDDTDGLSHNAPTLVGGTLTAAMATILPLDDNAGTVDDYAAGELRGPGEVVTITFDATIQ